MTCTHIPGARTVVYGVIGPKLVTWCAKCKNAVTIEPYTTRDYQAEMRERCRQDAKDAGPAIPCTCGDGQVLLGKRSAWCGCCYSRSVARLLDEVPLERLENKGL